MDASDPTPRRELVVRRLGIDTHDEPVVFIHAESPVARAEGLESHSRVRVESGGRHLIATLNVVRAPFLEPAEIGLSEAAWRLLGAGEGSAAHVRHPDPVDSFSHVRAKIFGHTLDQEQLKAIVQDIARGRYSNAQIAAFVTAAADDHLDPGEIVALTRAMVDAGRRLHWQRPLVADKHCVGGLPGNRTSPLVVAIAACHDILIPKTSSRAITSPAGTADCMETLTRVDLDLEEMRRVVEAEGGCLAWGGSVSLSPADDVLIRVERSLDIDSEGQLIASVLSKKIAAGASHVIIDVPVGPTAKVRSPEAARRLGGMMQDVAEAVGLTLRVVESDGSQPIGRGIGPALEARDVLAVLDNHPHAPVLLREKCLDLAGALLEMCGIAGDGRALAEETLVSGRAMDKFVAICKAQGGFREPPEARHRETVHAGCGGRLAAFDNRRLARTAKLAGAPADKAAGVLLHARVGDRLERGQPLLTLHAQSSGELDYAMDYYAGQNDIIRLEEDP